MIIMGNVIVVEKGTEKDELEARLKSLKVDNKFPASKFCGKIDIDEDPLKIQKRLRDEWR